MAKAKSLFAVLKEKTESDYNVEFTAVLGSLNNIRIVMHYII